MISFITPAHNEERLLGATLDALHSAARAIGEPYELIVVDDASTDKTAEVAQQHGAQVVSVAHRQIAATRNSGARSAAGDMFIFVDADTHVNEAVVRAAVQAMRDGAVGGGSGFQFDGEVPFYARVMTPIMVRLFRVAGLAAGCFLFCTRSGFAASGGFDEAYFGAEELVMSRALKRHGKFVVVREAVTTSGRKLRTYSGREILALMFGLTLRGTKGVKQREGMDLWYAERRHDPHEEAQASLDLSNASKSSSGKGLLK